MQRTAVVSESGLRDLLGRIIETSRVMAPVKRGKLSYDFEWISSPDDVELDYVRTVLPPKKALLPPREDLLKFEREDAGASPVIEEEPFVLFGVHSCDLTGIRELDWAMGQRHGVPDPHYLARRKAATIVGMSCSPDEYCFCTSVGSSDTKEGADLFVTAIDGGYFVEVLSEKGEELMKLAPDAREASADDEIKAKAALEARKEQITNKINAPAEKLPGLLEQNYASEIFEATAERCYSCGTCTNVCPTCFCFDVDDEVDLLLSSGTRERKYDSCQFQDFALVAGGHNFRGDRSDRVRHRWFRKFVYLAQEHGRPFCVGCGRCSKQCTAGISLVDVVNSVLAEAREEVAT